jgi:hypothetical protein
MTMRKLIFSANSDTMKFNFAWRSIITLMMEEASTCEKLVSFYQSTWRNIPEDAAASHFTKSFLCCCY